MHDHVSQPSYMYSQRSKTKARENEKETNGVGTEKSRCDLGGREGRKIRLMFRGQNIFF